MPGPDSSRTRRGLLLPGVTLIDIQAMTDLMIEAALSYNALITRPFDALHDAGLMVRLSERPPRDEYVPTELGCEFSPFFPSQFAHVAESLPTKQISCQLGRQCPA